MIHVYAYMPAPARTFELTGLDDAPLECRTVRDVAVLFSRHARAFEPTEAAVRRHAAVVEAAMHDAPAVLPGRFGHPFADDASMERAVADRAAELHDRLRLVEGCVELGVRALESTPRQPPLSTAGGAEYLHARLREANERERRATELHDALRGVARESTHQIPPSGRVLLSAAYLVPAEERQGFEERVRELELAQDELAVVCTGPWPPYSFASTVAA